MQVYRRVNVRNVDEKNVSSRISTRGNQVTCEITQLLNGNSSYSVNQEYNIKQKKQTKNSLRITEREV